MKYYSLPTSNKHFSLLRHVKKNILKHYNENKNYLVYTNHSLLIPRNGSLNESSN
jgi:hypothetical protein